MKRFWLLVLLLAFMSGCAAPGEKGVWDDFLQDLRGDNMKMRNDFAGPSDSKSMSK